MLYLDYNWDLTPHMIIPDPELDTDHLQWKPGDYWRVVELKSGKKALVKLDPLVKFIDDGLNSTKGEK